MNCREPTSCGPIKPGSPENKSKMKIPGKIPPLPKELSKVSSLLNKNVVAKHLVLGTVSGWTSAYFLMRLGRPVAFAVGGGIILSQVAHHAGYIDMDWNKLKNKAESSTKSLKTNPPELLAKAKTFARANPYFTAGFVGGFLIGAAVS